jgi:hypothetical protein
MPGAGFQGQKRLGTIWKLHGHWNGDKLRETRYAGCQRQKRIGKHLERQH